jgi:hypothetical protein
MKHLKIYENKGDVFYIVMYEDMADASSNWQVMFEDEESAENYYVETVNDFVRDKFYMKKKKFTENDFILTFEDSVEWMDENEYDSKLYCNRIESRGTHELPYNIKIAREAKKYNL